MVKHMSYEHMGASITYNIYPPNSIANMFGNWLMGVDKLTKTRIRIGVSAICWSI